MNDKYAKEIAKELKLIRRELQKMNKTQAIKIDSKEVFDRVMNEGGNPEL